MCLGLDRHDHSSLLCRGEVEKQDPDLSSEGAALILIARDCCTAATALQRSGASSIIRQDLETPPSGLFALGRIISNRFYSLQHLHFIV
jgi:hypothetical protein